MNEWRESKLGDIADVRDGTHDSPKEVMNGKYLITSKHIKNGKIDFSKAYKISLNDFEAVNKRSKVHKFDILFSMIGTIGEMVIVDFEPDFAIKNVGLFKTGDKNLSKWIYYYLKSDDAQAEIDASLKGSTQQYITLGDLRNFPIKLPPLEEQKAITEVLSSLDDKIDLLHRQNKTLEELAQTFFCQWFIEEAKEEWAVGTLDDIVNFNPSYKLKQGELATYLAMESVQTDKSCASGWYKRAVASGAKFMNNDTLLARITPSLENGKTAFVDFLEDNEIGWGSTEFIVMRMKDTYHPFISYLIARNQDFRNFAIGNMTGSTGRQRAQAEDLKKYEISIPPCDEIQKLNELLEPVPTKIKANWQQIQTLANLRDTLLPKLLSGEVRVKG